MRVRNRRADRTRRARLLSDRRPPGRLVMTSHADSIASVVDRIKRALVGLRGPTPWFTSRENEVLHLIASRHRQELSSVRAASTSACSPTLSVYSPKPNARAACAERFLCRFALMIVDEIRLYAGDFGQWQAVLPT